MISFLVVLCCLILLSGGSLRAQSIYGTITGTVYDPSGAVVGNATVILKNVASGDLRKGATNSDGYYSFSSVPTGSYSITVEAAGFEKTVTEGIELSGAASLNLPTRLTIGASTTEVKVEGDRKSTRLNSSHTVISYAVFCLKKKKKTDHTSR